MPPLQPAPQLAGIQEAGRIIGLLGLHLVPIHYSHPPVFHSDYMGIEDGAAQGLCRLHDLRQGVSALPAQEGQGGPTGFP